jgi:hypothetical protein
MNRAWSSPRLQQLREDWRSNQRLRWGVFAIGVIGFVYLCLVLVDWRRDLHQQYQQRTLQMYKVAALADQEYWLLRVDSAKALDGALQAEIPRVATIGLAQAEAQTNVRQIVNAFGPKLAVDARPPAQVRGQPGLWRIPISLRGMVTQPQLLQILRRIESADRLVTIEEFSLGFVQRQPNIVLTMVAFYRVGNAGEASNAAP